MIRAHPHSDPRRITATTTPCNLRIRRAEFVMPSRPSSASAYEPGKTGNP
jgi:hypothetical protein